MFLQFDPSGKVWSETGHQRQRIKKKQMWKVKVEVVAGTLASGGVFFFFWAVHGGALAARLGCNDSPLGGSEMWNQEQTAEVASSKNSEQENWWQFAFKRNTCFLRLRPTHSHFSLCHCENHRRTPAPPPPASASMLLLLFSFPFFLFLSNTQLCLEKPT